MANENQKTKPNEDEEEEEAQEEPKIPVFTVLKNGAILKNIFIVNRSPPPPHSKPISAVRQGAQEEILIVGRHPDCNIVLTHPSVSRFHLQILSDPCAQKLCITDLSSVHGTWVSDRRIEPGVRVEMSQGDTLRVGGSSRVYSLHWIPLSKAYNFETSFVPWTNHRQEESSEQVDQGDISLSVESKDIESPDSNAESEESLFSGEIPSAQPMPDDAMFSICDQSKQVRESWSKDIGGEHKELSGFWAFGTEAVNLFMDIEESHPCSKEYQCLQPHDDTDEVSEKDGPNTSCVTEKEWGARPSAQPPGETENQSPLGKDNGQADNLCLSRGEILEETKVQSVEENGASPAAQVPEKSDNQSPLGRDHGEFGISCISSRPLVTGNLPLRIAEVPGEAINEHVEQEGLTTEPQSNMLVNLKNQQMDVTENEAYLAALLPKKIDNQTPLRKDDGQTDLEGLAEAKDQQDAEESLIPEPQSNILVNLEIEHINGEKKEAYPAGQVPEKIGNQTENSCQLSGPLRMESLSLSIGEVLGKTKDEQVAGESLTPEPKSTLLVNLNVEHPDVIGSLLDERLGETESKRLSPEDNGGRDVASICSGLHITESINSSLRDRVLSELIDDKENQTPQSLYTGAGKSESEFCESPPLRSENMRGSIWARRGKPASAVEIQTDKRRGKRTTDAGYDDGIEQAEEIFTPDKENFTPNTLRLRSLKKEGKIEVKHSKPRRSSSSILTVVSNVHEREVYPDKENQKLTRKSVGTASGNQARVENNRVTKVSRERMPFQSLLSNSGGKNGPEASVPSTAARSSTSLSCTQTTETATIPLTNKSASPVKWGWTMVVDTTTLLDKESRKSLQLLRGLKGTRLIIPKIVIRELDCLKQRGSLFRKKTEASLVLEWIEECMVETDWWIHVQSSIEDSRLIAPTPPVSPQSLFSENSWGFPHVAAASSLPSSRCSFMDLVSPAPEDHLLDCALVHRKMKNDGHLVLLSNDVTLKIKAMAEGLLCETAEEFRASLVNPLSERFMWPDSSPRGRTWSYVPDVILREKYNRCALKKSSKVEGAKGLKLILLHNSHYGHIR